MAYNAVRTLRNGWGRGGNAEGKKYVIDHGIRRGSTAMPTFKKLPRAGDVIIIIQAVSASLIPDIGGYTTFFTDGTTSRPAKAHVRISDGTETSVPPTIEGTGSTAGFFIIRGGTPNLMGFRALATASLRATIMGVGVPGRKYLLLGISQTTINPVFFNAEGAVQTFSGCFFTPQPAEGQANLFVDAPENIIVCAVTIEVDE